LLRKIFSYSVVEMVAKGLNKSILLLLPLLLSTADYGRIGLIIAAELFLPVITLLGLERAILRFYSEKIRIPNFEASAYTGIRISHLFLLLIGVVLYISGVERVFSLYVWPDIILLILLVYGQGYHAFVLRSLRVEEQHHRYFRARIINQISKFVFVMGWVWVSLDYKAYLYGSIASILLTNLLFKPKDSLKVKNFDGRTFKQLFIFSWPFVLHGIAGNLLSNADKFIIERYLGISDVGTYTLAYSFGSMMMFAYVVVGLYVEPLVYKQRDKRMRKTLLQKYLGITILAGVLLYLILSLSSHFIFPKIYRTSYAEAFEIIPLLSLLYLLYPFYLKNSYELIYQKRTLSLAFMSIGIAVIGLLLNIWLIPFWGLKAPVYVLGLSIWLRSLGFNLLVNNFHMNGESWLLMVLLIIIAGILYLNIDSLYIGGALLLMGLVFIRKKWINSLKEIIS